MTSPPGFPGAAARRLASLLLVAVLSSIASTGCARPEAGPDPSPRGYYQTAPPTAGTSEQLEEAFQSVKQIHTRVFYDTYVFSPDQAPVADQLGSSAVMAQAIDTVSASHERSASAVVLVAGNERAALVTVAHALTFADTLVEFSSEDTAALPTSADGRRVRSVSIKTRQTNWITGPEGLHRFEILARDEVRDLALLGVQLTEGASTDIRALTLPPGDPSRLSWGSFVYVMGYPRTYPMVTRGIVSAPGHPALDSFLVDGLWNPGMSGGLILAVRGANERLEWIGMARAAVGSSEPRLVPEDGALENNDLRRPYDGPIYLEEVRPIDYGITLSISMSDIRRFLDDHRSDAAQRGYDVPSL